MKGRYNIMNKYFFDRISVICLNRSYILLFLVVRPRNIFNCTIQYESHYLLSVRNWYKLLIKTENDLRNDTSASDIIILLKVFDSRLPKPLY